MTQAALPSQVEPQLPTTSAERWSSLIRLRLVLLLPVAIATLISGVELWAWLRPPNGLAFSGIFWAPEDIAPYWAGMREAVANGTWLIHDRLTTEPHDPALLYPFYIAAAKLASAVGLTVEAAYFCFAWLARTFFLICLGALITAFVAPRMRNVAYGVAAAGGGFAFIVLLVAAITRQQDLVGQWAVDWRYIELNTFLGLFSYPHHLLSMGCLACLLLLRLRLDAHISPVLLLSFAAFVATTALANSFSLIPAGVALAAYGLWRVGSRRGSIRHELVVGLVFMTVAAPFLLYTIRTFAQDPFWATAYGTQNTPHLQTPALPQLLSSLGLLVPLGVVGAIALVKERASGAPLLLIWLGVLLALMLLPLPYQRRYGLGMPMLLALVGTRGLFAIAESKIWQRVPNQLRELSSYVAFLALVSSAIGVSILMLSLVSTGRGAMSVLPVFERATVLEAAYWLAANSTEEDVVLGDWRTANVMMRYAPGTAVSAHPIATLDAASKDTAVRRFFSATSSVLDRDSIVASYGITLIVVGPRERDLGASDDRFGAIYDLLYRSQDVTIYRVALQGGL